MPMNEAWTSRSQRTIGAPSRRCTGPQHKTRGYLLYSPISHSVSIGWSHPEKSGSHRRSPSDCGKRPSCFRMLRTKVRVNRMPATISSALAFIHCSNSYRLDSGRSVAGRSLDEFKPQLERVKNVGDQMTQLSVQVENPIIQKWQGLIALAEGQREKAIRQL